MAVVNCGLVSRLRERIFLLEKELTHREMKEWWDALREAEYILANPSDCTEEWRKKVEQKLKLRLGIRG